MKRVAYFGTPGSGLAGHHFKGIRGNFTYEEDKEICKLDSDKTFNVFEGKRQLAFFKYGDFLCLAFPASPDDDRGGSITIALVEKADSCNEVLETIESSDFLKCQFNRLSTMYKVDMPQHKKEI